MDEDKPKVRASYFGIAQPIVDLIWKGAVNHDAASEDVGLVVYSTLCVLGSGKCKHWCSPSKPRYADHHNSTSTRRISKRRQEWIRRNDSGSQCIGEVQLPCSLTRFRKCLPRLWIKKGSRVLCFAACLPLQMDLSANTGGPAHSWDQTLLPVKEHDFQGSVRM